jgi:hypothetical protein
MNEKKDWDTEMRIPVRGYHDSLQDFDFNFYLKVFSGVLSQAKSF